MQSLQDILYDRDNIDCIGITIDGGRMVEEKIYKFKSDLYADDSVASLVLNRNSFRKYRRLKSKESLKRYKEIMRKHYTQNGEIFYYKNIEKIATYASNFDKILSFRMMQVGVKMGEEKEAKAYFSLRKFSSLDDIKGINQSYRDIEETLRDVFNIIYEKKQITEKYITKFGQGSDRLERNGYYPSLLGINERKMGIELKLYFELFEPDKYIKNRRNISEIVLLNDSNEIERINDFFESHEFFLRGVGISDDNYFSVLKLYYADKRCFI